MHSLETPRRFVTPTGEPDLAEARRARQAARRHARRRRRLPQAQATDGHDRGARPQSRARAPPRPGTPRTSRPGPIPTRIALIARSHDLRDLLNQRARDSMRDSGLLGPDVHGIARVPLAVGDVVVCRQNDPRLAVTNGARGRITSITTSELTLAMSDQRSLDLPLAYAREGSLEHAYAITGHLAQAATFDAAMVVAPPHHHTQQWSYTALSRSRSTDATRRPHRDAHAISPPSTQLPLDPVDARDALTRLATCMTRDETA